MRTSSLLAALPLLVAGLGTVPAASAGSVQFTMTETHVDVGETVEFTITNHRNETIWLNGFPYWTCSELPAGQHGGPCVGLPMLYSLAAGQSETHTWNQIDCITELPVPAGLYRVQATWSSPSEPLFQDTEAFFCVGGDSACDAATTTGRGVETSTWGRVRGHYR